MSIFQTPLCAYLFVFKKSCFTWFVESSKHFFSAINQCLQYISPIPDFATALGMTEKDTHSLMLETEKP
jgi:hypothetical protein